MEVFYQDHFLAGYEKIFGARAYGTIPLDDHRQTGIVHLTSDLLFLRIFQSPFISKPCHNIHYINRIL